MPQDLQAIIREAGNTFVTAVEKAYDRKGKAVIGLVGGRSVKGLYDHLPTLDFPLTHTYFMFGDEYCAGETSNYMTAETMFNHLKAKGLPEENVARYEYDPGREDWGLEAYAERLAEKGGSFDLLVLGAGEDGHILSLFPDHPSVKDDSYGYIKVLDSPKPPRTRVSISRDLACSAEESILFFMGEAKKEAYMRFRDPKETIISCPAKIVLDNKRAHIYSIF